MAGREQHAVTLSVTCINPPVSQPASRSTVFGLQPKKGPLQPGVPQDDGSLRFEVRLKAVRAGGDAVTLTGDTAFGTPSERFLYLTLQNADTGEIIRRLKIHLQTITWTQVEAAADGGCLSSEVAGTGAASVPLLGAGWVVRR